MFFFKQWRSYSNEDVHFLQLLLIFLTCWSTYRHTVILEHLLPNINKTSIVRDVARKNPGTVLPVLRSCYTELKNCTISLNTFVKRSISNHHNLCFIAPLGNSSIVPQSFSSHFHHLISLLAIFGRNPEHIRHKNCKEMILAHGKSPNSSEQRREWIKKFKRIQKSQKQLKMVVNDGGRCKPPRIGTLIEVRDLWGLSG